MFSTKTYRHFLVLIPSVLLPLLFGGSHEAFWAPVAGIFFLGAAIFYWFDSTETVPFNWHSVLILTLCLAFPFFQAIPLPGSWVQFLSPMRAHWLDKAQIITGENLTPNSLSYLPLRTFFYGLLWLFLASFAFFLRNFFESRRERHWYYNFLLAIATFEAAYGLIQVLIPSVGVLWDRSGAYSGVARGTFINRNHFAAFLGLLWPLLLGHVLSLKDQQQRVGSRQMNMQTVREQTRHKQTLFGFLIALIILALIFSMSRAAILCSVIGATVFVILSGIRRRRVVIAVVGCWLIMFAYGSVIGFDKIIERFNIIETSAAGRFEIYRETWNLVSDHPLVGTGLGSYNETYKIYQAHLPETGYTRHSHNDYLQMAAELGLPFAIVISLMVWGIWWKYAIKVFRAKAISPPENHFVSTGALAGTAAFLLHCWLDFNWQMAANAAQFIALLVLIHVLNDRKVGKVTDPSLSRSE